jgi:hypothetical protein
VKRTLSVLNELERDGFLVRYALGGAMAATFYAEPLLTFDLDVFVLLPKTGSDLVTLAPVYQALRDRGFTDLERECVLVDGVPVQFLPAYNSLIEEALDQAAEIDYEGLSTRVVRPEHLLAICLQTGRSKDRERVRVLREQASLDANFLADVIARHQLEKRWKAWTT